MDVILAFIIFITVISIWITAGKNGTAWARNNSTAQWNRDPYSDNYVTKSKRETNRRIAIQKVKPFLKPYKELMGNLCISNGNCKVDLVVDKSGEKKIICINKHLNEEHKREMFTAVINPKFANYYTQPLDYVIDNIFDTLCSNFSYSTVYENIISAASMGMLIVNETLLEPPKQNNIRTDIPRANQLNLNTATEAEILALPGVNVIIAKKALKYIEKNGGFNSVDEFIEKMKIKENFAEQIKNIAFANKTDYSKDLNTQNNKEDSKTPTENLDLIDYNKDINSDNNNNERIIDL